MSEIGNLTGDPPVPRAGLLHAVGGSRRCGVVIALESGELSIPEGADHEVADLQSYLQAL